jgi:hypothetical protein
MVYDLTKTGQSRLALLKKTVRFRRDETNESKKYRSYQLMVEKMMEAVRQRSASPWARLVCEASYASVLAWSVRVYGGASVGLGCEEHDEEAELGVERYDCQIKGFR